MRGDKMRNEKRPPFVSDEVTSRFRFVGDEVTSRFRFAGDEVTSRFRFVGDMRSRRNYRTPAESTRDLVAYNDGA